VVLSGYSGFFHHDIAETLLKVALSIINQIKSIKSIRFLKSRTEILRIINIVDISIMF